MSLLLFPRQNYTHTTWEDLVNSMQSLWFNKESVTQLANFIKMVFKERFPNAKI